MSDYSDLKRLAEAATPGPWYARDYGNYDGSSSHWFIDTQSPCDIVDDQDGGFSPNHWDDARGELDMKFIAGASPNVVLALIAENESLRADAERYRWLRSRGILLEGHDFISFDEIADYRIDVEINRSPENP